MVREDQEDVAVDFSALGLGEELLAALTKLGYEEPTPIQREAIPPLLEGHDLVGQAATGTGKTAAFALPVLERLSRREGKRRGPYAMILVPTRELAMQVAEAMYRYGRALDASVLAIYGGQPFGPQLRGLERGVDIIVATPGRALDHIRRGTLKLEGLATVVLDEADEMLDMGFADDIEAILSETQAEQRQTVLFSATMPQRIAAIAKRHLRDPVKIQIAKQPVAKGAAPRVRQTAYVVQRALKPAALARVIDLENPTSALVFCRTRTEVDDLTESLSARGYRAEGLHGGMSQQQRSRVLKRLREGIADLVIATDVAARGLDIEHLSHVINYDVPCAAESYVHRIGRVGRAGREGVAITLLQPREHRLLRNFEQATKQKIAIEQVPTVADLRARRLELTRAAVREAILEDDLESFRVVVESLCEEYDPLQIAAAAIKLAHEATETSDKEEVHIPQWSPESDRSERPQRSGPPRERGGKPMKSNRRSGGPVARLYVGAGREAGVRPQDLVGAIASEANLSGSDIGGIEITQRFSLVEVPEDQAANVIAALRTSKIRGRKVVVRRDRAT